MMKGFEVPPKSRKDFSQGGHELERRRCKAYAVGKTEYQGYHVSVIEENGSGTWMGEFGFFI